MEQPCCADCRRSLDFRDSSRFLIVILAIIMPPMIALISLYSKVAAVASSKMLVSG
jgi:hypothetical protein